MQYNKYWGAGLIVIGLALAFAGNKFINVAIFLVASVAVAAVGLSLTFFIIKKFYSKPTQYVEWRIFYVFIGLGSSLGALLVKKRKYGIGILAAWGGVMLGFLITTMFVMKDVYMYYGIIVLCAVVLCVISI